MHRQTIRVGIVSRLAIATLLITILFIADGRLSIPFAARPVYAASRTFCVNLAGGQTHAPCTNRTAYTTIQAAIDASRTGDEIRIATGTYTTSHPGYAVVII